MCVDQNLVEKSCATAVGGGAHHHGRGACRIRGGRFRLCCRVVDPHHDRRGERRSSFPSFPLTFPTMCPNVIQRQPLIGTLGKTPTYGSRGGRDPGVPPISPRLASTKTRSPHVPRAPCSNAIFARCQFLTRSFLCSRCSFVAVMRVLASPSATPKFLSGTSTWGTAAATRSHEFPVRNGETVFVFNFLLFVFITRGPMKMYLMAARPWICIFRRAKEAATVRWLHVT